MVLSDGSNDEGPSKRAADEHEGRYAIGLSPPKKRRKTGKYPADAHVVTFTADSDDSDSDRDAAHPKENDVARRKERLQVKDQLGPSTGGAEGPIRIKGMGSRSSSGSSLDPAAKRDYWLSKAVGPGGSGSDD